ncbi:MAG: DUF4234 domain-containing protein [Clostridia bacterium]|nr:DUF4234 domain-containing protein [Clostridia bacterium]
MRLKDNRSFIGTFLLTIVTAGIYGFYLIYVMARDTNIACAEDGKHTLGLALNILLSIVTFGIYSLIWSCIIISRWGNFQLKYGKSPRVTVTSYLLWMILGAFIIIGPLVAYCKFLNCFNDTCSIYNQQQIA